MARARKPHALVIEADRDCARTLCDLLDIQGCTAASVQDLPQAFDTISRQLPDIVFCDLSPAKDAAWLKMAQRLINDAARNNILLIAMTQHADPEDDAKILRSGFDMVFPKPLKLVHLRAALSALLRGNDYPPEYGYHSAARANPVIRP